MDSGTTNTRISLVCNNVILQTLRYNVGARVGIENKSILKQTLKKGIAEILENNRLTEKDVERILACGMITCEFGLMELEHLKIPAGIEELHNGMYEWVFKDISELPFVFVRGLKTSCDDLESSDMMRGEESELMGIGCGEAVYVLPGSHSKIIEMDGNGRIVDFKTMLTGEMISSITSGTILKDAVALGCTEAETEGLCLGYKYADKHGINEALFKVRVLKNLLYESKNRVYSFFMGAILHGEIKGIIEKSPKKIVVGGKRALKDATVLLLKALTDVPTVSLSDEQVEGSTSYGMIKIYENRSGE